MREVKLFFKFPKNELQWPIYDVSCFPDITPAQLKLGCTCTPPVNVLTHIWGVNDFHRCT